MRRRCEKATSDGGTPYSTTCRRSGPTRAEKKRYSGWPRSRAAIVDALSTKGPFNGVLGFSQGACATSLLPALLSANTSDALQVCFDFAIMVGGYPCTDPVLAQSYDKPAYRGLPSLHILGTGDGVVPPSYARALAAKFVDPIVLEHDGGHVIPSSPRIKEALHAFLHERVRRRREFGVIEKLNDLSTRNGSA
jgi:pimeloyl-ACP methyl ester carboxylesterase